jgi:hypothetical protein
MKGYISNLECATLQYLRAPDSAVYELSERIAQFALEVAQLGND